MNAIAVHVADLADTPVIGQLFAHRRGRTESATFSYDSTYLANPRAYAVDPLLPLVRGALQSPVNRATFGAFADCAPDRWGRSLLDRRERTEAVAAGRTPRTLGEMDYLLGVRDDLRQGSLRFSAPAEGFLATAAQGVPVLTELGHLLDLADRWEQDAASAEDLSVLLPAGSSLGGARPKAHVRDTDGSIAIAKFPSARNDTWNVMAWEWVALELARTAGIATPDARLLDIAGRSVLLVRRFDRVNERRIGYVSAMTMLEASDGDERSYLDIAEVIERVSDQPSVELLELFRRMVFSILIRNTDNHLRNHGFVHAQGDVWRLSPAFDLNPTPNNGPLRLSTSLDGSAAEASIDRAVHLAECFRLDRTAAEQLVLEVAEAVAAWPKKAREAGLDGAEVRRMQPAFSALDDLALREIARVRRADGQQAIQVNMEDL